MGLLGRQMPRHSATLAKLLLSGRIDLLLEERVLPLAREVGRFLQDFDLPFSGIVHASLSDADEDSVADLECPAFWKSDDGHEGVSGSIFQSKLDGLGEFYDLADEDFLLCHRRILQRSRYLCSLDARRRLLLLEAREGVEPTITGFADRCLSAWPPSQSGSRRGRESNPRSLRGLDGLANRYGKPTAVSSPRKRRDSNSHHHFW